MRTDSAHSGIHRVAPRRRRNRDNKIEIEEKQGDRGKWHTGSSRTSTG